MLHLAGGTSPCRRLHLAMREDQGRLWCLDYTTDHARNLPSLRMRCSCLYLHKNGRNMLEQSIAVYCKIGQRESQMARSLSLRLDGRPGLCTLGTDFQVSITYSQEGLWLLRAAGKSEDTSKLKVGVERRKMGLCTYGVLQKCSTSSNHQFHKEFVGYQPSCHNPGLDPQHSLRRQEHFQCRSQSRPHWHSRKVEELSWTCPLARRPPTRK